MKLERFFARISNWFSVGILLAGLAVVVGCEKQVATPKGVLSMDPSASTNAPWAPSEAQGKLTTVKLFVGAEQMDAELCSTPHEVETGMMFRRSMGTNDGMLFTLFYPQQAGFWMKNCYIPLSVAYIDPDGVIEEIHPLQVQDTNTVFSTATNVRFALETPQGWFDVHHVTTGMVVRTERGSLMETFGQK